MRQVSNISFPDLDLDETDLGGSLSWMEPETVGSLLALTFAPTEFGAGPFGPWF